MFFPLRDEENYLVFPIATIVIIVVDVLVFFYSISAGESAYEAFVGSYGVIPAAVSEGKDVSTLVTSLFLHGSILHLLSNMWFLWIFGDNIEYHLGSVRYLIFYILSGIVGTLFYVVGNADSTIPLIGASGAISGILGAYLVLHPRGSIHSLLFLGFFIDVVRVPAIVFIGFWFILQVLLLGDTSSPVAYAAHIGGFVAGFLMILALRGKVTRPYLL
ncbi:MAG: rhomboid family intramembrane serine protease [Parcubacteria group bacterium]|nr:rhomboid family intramembrane serine protease [Parcubacteria group bacterium]